VLAPSIKTTAGTTKIVTAACLKRKEPEERTLLRSLAFLWCYGAPLVLPTHTEVHIGVATYIYLVFLKINLLILFGANNW
jgi:hypothetical protein